MSFDVQSGERLSSERERLKLSQQAMSDECGVARVMLSRYERGVAEPGASALIALSGVGVDVLYVLTGVRTPQTAGSLSPEEIELLKLYKKADTQGRDAVQAVAALAGRTGGVPPKGGNVVSIGGNVKQAIGGDATFSAPVSFGKKNK